MLTHSIRLAQIQLTELQEQADQASRLGCLRVIDTELEEPTTRGQSLRHWMGEFMIVARHWLKSGHQLSC